MGLLYMCGFTLLMCSALGLNVTHNDNVVLSRKRRYLTFPDGSTFSFAFCFTMKALTDDYDIYTEAVGVSANYDLPSTPETLFKLEPLDEKNNHLKRRRHRRDVYEKVERVINAVGMDGRSCLLRTICEGAQRLMPKIGMLEELIRIIFTVPTESMSTSEPREHWQYSTAYRSGLQKYNCETLYPRCPLSLLSILLEMQPEAFRVR